MTIQTPVVRKTKHGIIYTMSRQQPWAVWVHGNLVRFCETEAQAIEWAKRTIRD